MTVLRVRKTENFVILHKGALEDPNLSFKAKGLWAYCLSRPDDWVFHVKHLSTVSQDGEDAVYSAIKELQEAGYIRKIQTQANGRFQKVDYEIYEIPIEIQKILPLRDFPDAVFPDAENPALLSIDPIPSIEEEIISRPSASPPPQAVGISTRLLQAILKTKPDFKQRDLRGWVKEIELMSRLDNRSWEAIEKVIEWLPSNSFWAKNVLSAGSLRKQFDRLELEMKSSRSNSKDEDNILVDKLKQRTDLISRRKIVIGADYVEFPELYEAHFKVGEPSFKDKVLNSLRKIGVPVS